MSILVAAMKGKFGSTEYFLTSMKAQELVGKVVIPSEMEGWDNMTLEEREQRDINYTRVINQIVPYLAKDKDRFFGSVIVTARGLDPDASFEHISEIATKGIPKLYQNQTVNMGFLTIDGGVQLFPLDGQHRLKALEFAISGKSHKEREIANVRPDPSLAEEDVSVILIPYDRVKSRKIFTKVNRYAKPTTTSQNLVTDDDDIIAVLSRDTANNQNLIGARLVKYKNNTLSDKDMYFTTLPTLAECNEAILNAHFPKKVDRTQITEPDTAKLYKGKVDEVWKFLVEHIELFSDSLEDKDEGGDDRRKEIRQDYLLGKPVPQACLVKVFVRLTTAPTNFTYEQAANKLNSVDWLITAKCWDRLLISGGKIQTKNRVLVTDVLCCQLGEKVDNEKKTEVLKKYRALFSADEQKGITELPKLTK